MIHMELFGVAVSGIMKYAMAMRYNVMSSNSMHWCNIMQFNAMR